ncbi:inner-membrane translocator [Chloroherpeton thalassium ATCC 35110]|uniref:Inner-membrane translocator n=1 Tax=Chloroherpeton thalassium (strain ATCC 35110 / GB-78) TaxID=517418 RepID=B3QRT0_CHLT3|nr:ABC transporter permease [Chloroherpeton thalassium]ACF13883.1 inner-membrane translocator [Chloroherpeton thalassium ATCC 35110]
MALNIDMTLSKTFDVLIPIAALFVAFALGGILIWLIGQDPFAIYGKMFSMTLGNEYGIGQVLFRATPLILTGLAVAIPFQAGLFNIGGEGQVAVSAFACALTGMALPESMPSVFAVAICLLVSMLVGAAWSGFAGFLRVKRGINEVITTIMMNFIAAALVGYFLMNRFAVRASVHTPEIIANATLARLDALMGIFPHTPLNLSFFLSIMVACFCYVLMYQVKYGYELRAVGLNPDAAKYAGINVGRHLLFSMVLAGALIGLVAANLVLGYKHYYELGMTSGLGFLGIAVAMLAGSNPLWIVFSALLFGLLDYGGLTINSYVPKEVFLILQAIVILFIIGAQKAFQKKSH